MSTQTFPGAKWWKVDLHAHSPSSFDFGALEGERAAERPSVREWLLAYMQSDIDALVVADHNAHEGVDLARQALDALRADGGPSFRELTIFPGVELTTDGGLHLLAIFDVDIPSERVNAVLHQCEYQGDRGASDGTTKKSFQEAVKIIVESGGLAVPAHADATAGVFGHDSRGLDAIVQDGHIVAAEVTTEDGAARAVKAGWIPVLGSDAHHLDGASCPEGLEAKFPGSHFTWVKMETPNLGGLKLALTDGPGSLIRGRKGDLSPAHTSHSQIRSVIIHHAGDEVEHDFSPWMNALIGGRGVGKSTLMELVRLTMGRFDELPARLQSDQAWFSPTDGRVDSPRFWNADTSVAVDYVKAGIEYRITWSGANPSVSTIQSRQGSEWVAEQGVANERFPVLIYSQKQIYETAQDPQSLIRIIDAQPGVARSRWLEQFGQLTSRYRRLRSEAAEMTTTIASEGRVKGELSDTTAHLGRLTELRDSPEMKELDDLDANERSSGERERLAFALEQGLVRSLESYGEDERLESATESTWESERIRVTAIEAAIVAVRDARDLLSSSRQTWDDTQDSSPRLARIAELRALTQPTLEGAEDEGATENGFATIGALMTRKAELDRIIGDIDTAKTARAALLSQASSTLEDIDAHRRELTRLRQKFISQLRSGLGNLKLEVFAQADQTHMEDDLRRLTQKPIAFEALYSSKAGFRAALGGTAPPDPKYVDAVGALKDLLKSLRAAGAGSVLLKQTKGMIIDQRFFQHLDTLDAYDFETNVNLWYPEDWLRVRYNTSEDANLRNLDQGSPGQKTAALLAVILRLSDDPLLLDQPEDDLENKLIYDLVVLTLKSIKSKRQVIVVTHNANVVVNANAELVKVLKHAPIPLVEINGSMQNGAIRDAICQIMEGGRTAFKARYERLIGHGEA